MKGLARSIQNVQFIKESFFGCKGLSICEVPFGFSVLKYLMGFFCHPVPELESLTSLCDRAASLTAQRLRLHLKSVFNNPG